MFCVTDLMHIVLLNTFLCVRFLVLNRALLCLITPIFYVEDWSEEIEIGILMRFTTGSMAIFEPIFGAEDRK